MAEVKSRGLGFIFTALLLFCGYTYGQDKNIPRDYYLASGIPDSLKTDANAVIRYTMDEITVKAPGREVLKHHSITTVLNEKGDDVGELVLFITASMTPIPISR